MRPVTQTLPVNLLLEGALALVVGGGRVGLRKTQTLLDSGLRVRLVCPSALPEFDDLVLEHCKKTFTAEDLTGVAIVFACTNDKAVNKAILAAARQAHILCGCVDGNWINGDFTTPAIIRTEDLIYTISTNGRSCRESKEVKTLLERFLKHTSAGELFIHGLSHDSASIDQRSLAALATREIREQISARLSFLNGLYEWCFVNTCNRIEIIAWATPELIQSGLLNHALHLPQGAYTLTKDEALKHLTFTLAGLNSQVIGEFHITGQIRDAFNEARDLGWARRALQAIYALALQRSQQLRTAVQPLMPRIELEDLALNGTEGPVIIAGTGQLGRALIEKCKQRKIAYTVLYHTHPLENEPCFPLKDYLTLAKNAQRFISAITVPTPFFNADKIPCECYDLSVPRSIDGAGVIDLDRLKGDYFIQNDLLEPILRLAQTTYEGLCHENNI